MTFVAATLAFLFSGFYKGLVWLPLWCDLTALTGLVVCVLIVANPVRRQNAVAVVRSPFLWLLGALAGWLAIRLYPNFAPWGIRKLAEFVLFGVPAYVAGWLMMHERDLMRTMMRWLAYAAPPIAAVLAIEAAATNPYAAQGIGSGGYQLTGLFLAFSAVSALILAWPGCFAGAIFGISITGHISAAVFATVACVFVAAKFKPKAVLARGIATAAAAMLVYTTIVSPPLIVMRALYKSGGLIMMAADHYEIEVFAGIRLAKLHSLVTSALAAMPEESHVYQPEARQADRIPIWGSAISQFEQAPTIGLGYGAVMYAETARTAHNVVLELLAETGIVGGLVGLAIILLASSNIRYARDDIDYFGAGTFIILALTAMVSGYWGERLFLFALGMMAAGASRRHPA